MPSAYPTDRRDAVDLALADPVSTYRGRRRREPDIDLTEPVVLPPVNLLPEPTVALPQPVWAEPTPVEQVRTEQGWTEQAWAEPAWSEQAWAEPAWSEPARSEATPIGHSAGPVAEPVWTGRQQVPQLPPLGQPVALPAATVLPAPMTLPTASARRVAEPAGGPGTADTSSAPVFRTRAEARAAAAREQQLRTPFRDPARNVRRAPQQAGGRADRRRTGRRGLALAAAVVAVGGLGAVAALAGALPTQSSQEPATLGPQAAAGVDVLASRQRTELSSASIAGDLGDKAFRMIAVSRSQERGPISGCSGVAPTQKYANGELPESVLCKLPFAPGHMLRADAAVRLIRLDEVYKGQFGVDLCLTDSYRSLASQYSVAARKPGLAARPGTSEHGWGLAIDMCGGPDQVGSARRAWMLANAPAFGWDNPAWARPGGSKPEPWHWEFLEGE